MDETIAYILQNNPSVLNIKDKTGRTPMFCFRNPKIVHIFQDFDDNGLETDDDGTPVLQVFLKTNALNAKALMYSKIDTNGKDYYDNDFLISFDLEVFKYERKAKVKKLHLANPISNLFWFQ